MTPTASHFSPTPSDMVQRVRSIIEGYRAGPNRALAQDPPQNSVDAAVGRPVRIDYRLHQRQADGHSVVLLTVTDTNTTGLRGSALSMTDIERRAQ